ncbi:MAG TPA: type II toxin-antitoxin system HigB family toxin [Candidatus Obscuribacterales bacterium]
MEILNKLCLRDFSRLHPRSRRALARWLEITEAARWRHMTDVQADFASAEEVKGWVIFNLHGNAYRLVTVIRFPQQQVIIHQAMTHAEYDRWKP